jgi:hypothetical protein
VLRSKPQPSLHPEAEPAPVSERQQEIDRSLRGIQQMMAQALFRPLTPNEGMQTEWSDGRPTAEVVASFIKPNDRLSSFERLEIYNQQYWWRLLGVFQEDFRGLRSVLGIRKFDCLASAYLGTHGSSTWSLRDLGQYLVGFLEAHPELTAPHTALACDMARVEWAKVIAFDGPALPVLDPQHIAETAPDQLKLQLQPYITLLELRHPIDHMLKRLRESASATARASNAISGARQGALRRLRASASRTPIHLAVHRRDFSVYYKRLEPEAYRLLIALRDGASLAEACTAAFADSRISDVVAAEKIRTWFQLWMQLGWLAG